MSQTRVRRKRITPAFISNPAPEEPKPAEIATPPVQEAQKPVQKQDIPASVNSDNLQQVKRPKKRIVKPKEEKKEAASNSEFDTVTDDVIPEIDFLNSKDSTSSNGSSSFYSLSRKKSTIFFDDDDDQIPIYLTPNYDLSSIKTIETQRYLNKNSVEVNKKYFLKAMNEKENQFKETFQKSDFKKVNEEAINDPEFIKRELEIVINNNCSNVLSNMEKFNINECDFSKVQKKNIVSRPSDNALNHIYYLSKEEAVQYLKGDKDEPFSQMKKDLDVEMIKDEEKIIEESPIYLEVLKLFGYALEQTINLESENSFALILKITEFFTNGIKNSPALFFDKLYEQYLIDIKEKPELLIIQPNLLMNEQQDKSMGVYLAKKVIQLIQNSQCSALLRYLSTLTSLKEEFYYDDAQINNDDECINLANVISKIDCNSLIGEFPFKNIPQFINPISYIQLSKRIKNIVNKLLKNYKMTLLKKVNFGESEFVDIFHLFFNIFLTKKTGEVLPLDILWDIYLGISNSSFEHPYFEKFKSIINNPEVSGTFYRSQKALKATIYALNEKILPYIILFTINLPPIKDLPDPEYTQDAVKCIRISHSFLDLSFINININYETMKSVLNI